MTNLQQMSLGKRLRYERESHHWTQERLAEHIGGSVPSINRWENDRAVPRKDMIELLETAFGKLQERWGLGKQVVWNVPFLQNPYFTGRDAILQRLHKILVPDQTGVSNQIRALSGLGGIGKTQTAVEYAYRYANEYEAVLWVRADSPENLASDFAMLATTLDLREQAERNQFLVIAAVKRWLQDHSPWLLIFDNADDLSVVADFLPRRAYGAILLTTRSQITGPHIKKIVLDKLSQEEGIEFLLRHVAARDDVDDEDAHLSTCVSERERQAAQELWHMMDGLPLALDQAGKYIETRQSSLAEYVDLYRTQRAALLQERGTNSTAMPEYPNAVAATWSLAFERVKQKNPAAAELLRLCAFLSPDAMPEELITAGVARTTSLLQTLATSPLALNEAIGTLRAYSLVRREPENRLLFMHRLVQAVLQDSLNEIERRAWAEQAMLTVNAAFPHMEWGIWSECDRLLPHALLAAHYIEQYHIMSEDTGRLLYEMGVFLQGRARFSEAERYCQRALQMRERLLGPEHIDVACSLNGLANGYAGQGRFAEAEPLYQRALAMREQCLGFEHTDVAVTCNEFANLYRLQGKFTESERLFKRAFQIRERCLAPEHPLISFTLTGLGTLYLDQGKYAEAEPLLLRAVQMRERHPGPDLAHPLNNLACLYFEQGRYTEAEQLFLRTLWIREHHLGSEHPDLAHPLYGLADTYVQQGKYADAKPLYQRSLRLWEQHLGPEHLYVAYPLTGLANLYREKGKYAKAEPLYQRALQIRAQALEAQHPDHAEIMHGLARLWDAQGDREEAREWYERALVVRKQALGAEHMKTRETRRYFIAWLQKMGYNEEAAQLEAAQ